MNRDVKFRARDRNGKLHYFGVFDIFSADPDGEHFYIDQESWQLVRATLEQYTGLTDKNDNPIYEGDVVRVGWNDEAQPLWVEYQAPQFVMRFKTPSGAKSKSWSTFDMASSERQLYEVIGNTTDNPELLEKGQV